MYTFIYIQSTLEELFSFFYVFLYLDPDPEYEHFKAWIRIHTNVVWFPSPASPHLVYPLYSIVDEDYFLVAGTMDWNDDDTNTISDDDDTAVP